MKPLVIYLPGHGGMDLSKNPVYATAPDKMYSYRDEAKKLKLHHYEVVEGSGTYGYFFEGVWNRMVAELCAMETRQSGIDAITFHDGYRDMSLATRVNVINRYAAVRRVVVIEIHANAGKGHGVEIFTTPGETPSDNIATDFMDNWRLFAGDRLPIRHDYSDGDIDKEVYFFVIRKTRCPAILFEAGFFDNVKDVAVLTDPEYQLQIAHAATLTVNQYFFNI